MNLIALTMERFCVVTKSIIINSICDIYYAINNMIFVCNGMCVVRINLGPDKAPNGAKHVDSQ